MIEKDRLKKTEFEKESLFHQQTDGKVHFFHYAVTEDLLYIHTGIVGESEKTEVTRDEYAPFIYDTLAEDFRKNNSSKVIYNSYTLKYRSNNDFYDWTAFKRELKKELIWSGLGKVTGGSSQTETKEVWFYSVNEKLMLDLITNLMEKHTIHGVLKIFVNNNSLSCYGMGEAGGKLIYKK